MSIFDVIDGFIGREPPTRDRRRRHVRTRPRNPKERKSLTIHVDEDEIWREQFETWRDRFGDDIGELRLDIHGIRRLLIVICLLLLGSKGLDLAGITTLLGGP